jgi:pimeloyl-ACP methyl ester carboxylesterase
MKMSWPLRIAGVCLTLLLGQLVLPAQAADKPEQVAIRLLDHLDAGDYAAAEASFSTAMAAAVPADKLRMVWESLPAQAGKLEARGTPTIITQGEVTLVTIPLRHAKAALLAKVAVDDEGRVAGFLIQPDAPPPADAPSANARFIERNFSIGQGDRALPGTLTMPKNASTRAPVPAVVLVHGSGPNDRDETVGPNRPFLDIARGLAERGIASLRYEKRTRAHPEQFAQGDFGVDDETTDDAVAALAALDGVPGIDARHIYILGHSQGGMLAPRIAARFGHAAGMILLSAPARRLLDLLAEQHRYLFNADGSIVPAEQELLDELDRKIAAVRSGTQVEAKDTPLGLPVHYWRDIEAVDPVADALASDLPMLLLQGGRDFQVVDADWKLWTQALRNEPRATLKRYPTLNHLGIAGEGPGTLAEYNQPGHVDIGLIADTARWIEQQAH